MPAATKLIRTRIKSVASTRKITKAMELVAASKMRKATEAAVNSRPYSTAAEEILSRLAQHVPSPSRGEGQGEGEKTELALLREPKETKTELLIVVTSDRGLCGGLNANIIREADRYLKEQKEKGIEVGVVTVGKKGRAPIARSGANIVAEFTEMTDVIDYMQLRPISTIALDEFKEAKVDRVTLLYTEFQSALIQRPRLKTILPFSNLVPLLYKEGTGEVLKKDSSDTPPSPPFERGGTEYIFEPSPESVYTQMLPRFVETSVYQSILEAIASEHSARMMAMRNASDAADDIVEDLTLTYNQARQAAITQEIAEIAGGAAALE